MGSVVISIDAELRWGYHHWDDLPEQRLRSARDGWIGLLELLDRFDVPATWAFVGHLLLEECDGRHAGYPPGWFARERDGWADRPELVVAPELVEAVRDSRTDHELACHSFSHGAVGLEAKDLARHELIRSIALARERDITLRSFVFPGNEVVQRDVLAEWGFECYRGRTVGAVPTGRGNLLSRLLAGSEPVSLVSPRLDRYGLVSLPASMHLLRPREGRWGGVARIRRDPLLGKVRRGIDAAAESDGVFHVWLRPNDLVRQRHWGRLRGTLRYLDERRDDLEIETMIEVADRAREDPGTQVTVPGGPRDGT